MISLLMIVLASVPVFDDKTADDFFQAGFTQGREISHLASKHVKNAESRLKAMKLLQPLPENVERFNSTRKVYHGLVIKSKLKWFIPAIDMNNLRTGAIGIPMRITPFEADEKSVVVTDPKGKTIDIKEPLVDIDIDTLAVTVLTVLDKTSFVGKVGDSIFVFDNIPTRDIVDDDSINISIPMQVTGTRSLETVIGSTKTVYVLKVVEDPESIVRAFGRHHEDKDHPYKHKFELLRDGPVEGVVIDSDEKHVVVKTDDGEQKLRRANMTKADKKWLADNWW